MVENRLYRPLSNAIIENNPRLTESSNPLMIGSVEFTTILLRKLIAIPQRPPVIRNIPNKSFMYNHPSAS